MICLFFCIFSVQAKLVKDEHYVTGSNKYNWSDVCREMTKRNSPLIEYATITKLDCMGRKVSATDFCFQKEAANPYFARGYVEKKSRKIVCQSAKRVILKWKCEGKNDKYCQDSEVGCFLFKEKLARRLKLVHNSITDKKYLNCYFDIHSEEMELNL